ncbi:beta-lactamase family protein [Microbacteriaceae bacterium VKM Ac-2854]|nr:beta-lactamase family protein [Microbacteriaceae bacterium VKM Ac-2854]
MPLVILALAGCTGTSSAVEVAAAPEQQVSEAVAGELTSFLQQVQADAKSSGAMAGVWAPGVGSWESAIGTVSSTDQAPMTTDMHVRLGTGGTQAMTCQVVAALADDGTLDLDADVSTYLPTMPGLTGMTLRQLCQHTSGLADFATALWPTYLANPEREWPTLELVSAAQIHSAIAAPGVGWASSETGPLLAGLVVTAKTNRSWPDLYNEYIADRYGLSATELPSASTVDLPQPHPSGQSFGMSGPGSGPRCDVTLDVTRLSPSALGAAGGVVTTLADLRRLATGMAASPTSDQAWASPVPVGGSAPEWQTADVGGTSSGVLHGFSGAAPGFLTAAFSDPKSGLTVAVSVNNSSAGSAFIAEAARGLAAIAAESGAAAGVDGMPGLGWATADVRAAMDAKKVC